MIETLQKSQATDQIPYLRHRGQEVTDSGDIIEYIAKLNNINVDSQLTNHERAVSRAFMRMLDEGFCWYVE